MQCGNGITEGIFNLVDITDYCQTEVLSGCLWDDDNSMFCSETCDNGLLNGYLVNNTCCLTGCSEGSVDLLISAHRCECGADCADEDVCRDGFCKTTHDPEHVNEDEPCPTYTCYQSVRENSEMCTFIPITGPIEDAHLCRNESTCLHTLSCHNGAVVGTSPELYVDILQYYVEARCDWDHRLDLSTIVRPIYYHTNPLFPSPTHNLSYSVHGIHNYGTIYQMEVEDCMYDVYIDDDNNIYFEQNYVSNNASTCSVVFTYEDSCYGYQASVEVIFRINCCGDNILDPEYEQCDNDYFSEGECCNCMSTVAMYDPEACLTAQPIPIDAPCMDIPCMQATLVGEGCEQRCEWDMVDNLDLFCKEETACAHNLTCRDGIVSATVPHFEIIWNPPSQVYCTENMLEPPQLIWYDLGEYTPEVSIQVTSNCTMEETPVGYCHYVFTVESECGEVRVREFTIYIACCGDGIVQDGEQCDDPNSSCCSESCTFVQQGQICREPSDLCDAPEYCTGTSGVCPPDSVHRGDVVCFVGDGLCSQNSTCNGIDKYCPHMSLDDGTRCRFEPCSYSFCLDGHCNSEQESYPLSYDDGNICNGLETCDPQTGAVVYGPPLDCDDENACTIDSCQNNQCVHTPHPRIGLPCGNNVGRCEFGTTVCNSGVFSCVGGINPIPEICGNNLDDNCNGYVDELCYNRSCTTDQECDCLAHETVCQTHFCNTSIGKCVVSNLPTDTSCNTDKCSTDGKCNAFGTCVSGSQSRCVSTNNCLQYVCSPDDGECNPVCSDGSIVAYQDESTVVFCGDNSCSLDVPKSRLSDAPGYIEDPLVDCNDGVWCTIDQRVSRTLCNNTLRSGNCLIDGICYSDGEYFDSCRFCNASASSIDWSFAAYNSCDDGNLCTYEDTCNPLTLKCEGSPKPCYEYDSVCTKGVCDPSNGRCLSIPANEHLPCDENDGRCCAGHCSSKLKDDFIDEPCRIYSNGVWSNKPNYLTACPSEDLCDGPSHCVDGECLLVGEPVDCGQDTQCASHYCREGKCYSSLFCGIPCEPENPCHATEGWCEQGECIPSTCSALDCNDDIVDTLDSCRPTSGCHHEHLELHTDCMCDGDCMSDLQCHVGRCNRITHTCEYVALQAGTACGEHDVCAGLGQCSPTGVCVYDSPIIDIPQDASNPCVVARCHPQLGVIYTPLPDGPADDGDECTVGDWCVDGMLQTTPYDCSYLNTECMEYLCANSQCIGVPTNTNGPCDDGNCATVRSTCGADGVCRGVEITCPSPSPCDVDVVVNYETGECYHILKSVDTPCIPDGGLYDMCYDYYCDLEGQCVRGESPIVQCGAIDDCHLPGECSPRTGQCTTPRVHNGEPCGLGGVCHEGVCVVQCPKPPTQCHEVIQHNNGTCELTYAPENTHCCHEDSCVLMAACDGEGECVAIERVDCGESFNQCMDMQCIEGECVEIPLTNIPCEGACFTNQMCVEGQCLPNQSSQLTCWTNSSLGAAVSCFEELGCFYQSTPSTRYACRDITDCPNVPCQTASCLQGQCYYAADDTNLDGCTGDFCSGPRYCLEGTCIAAAPKSCDECDNDSFGCTDYDTSEDQIEHCHHAEDGFCEDTPIVIHQGQCWSAPVLNAWHQWISYPLPTGTPCDDGNPHTFNDRCDNGVCGSHDDIIYHTSQCQYSFFDHVSNSIFTANKTDGTPCREDTHDTPKGPCSGKTSRCLQGQCVREYAPSTQVCRAARVEANGCDLAEYCTGCSDECPEDAGLPNGAMCPHSFFCHESVCINRQCLPTAPSKIPDLPCFDVTCNEGNRSFILSPKPAHTPCDGNSDQFSQCTQFHSCDGQGECVPRPAASTVPCDDSNPCTIRDHCSGSDDLCVPGKQLDCTQYDTPCSRGYCNPELGSCVVVPMNEGGACDVDANPCTQDVCQSGSCVSGPVHDCSELDSNCSYGVCVNVDGKYAMCSSIANSSECNSRFCLGGCTLPFNYWAAHSKYETDPQRQTPWPDSLEDAVACDEKWYQLMHQRPKGSAWRKLFRQWAVVQLNIHSGACAPIQIQQQLEEANLLLAQCDTKLSISNDDADIYLKLAATFSAYNEGLLGPGHCIEEDTCSDSEGNDPDFCFPDHTSSKCINGVWNDWTDLCSCYVGWTGTKCDQCDSTPEEEGHTFLCVPTRLVGVDYVLRSIIDSDVENYLNDVYPFISIYGRPVVYPSTHGLDCACQGSDQDHDEPLISDDLHCQVIEHTLSICESSWNHTNNFTSLPGNHHINISTTKHHSSKDHHQTTIIVLAVLLGVVGFVSILMLLWVLYLLGIINISSRTKKYQLIGEEIKID